MGDIPSIAAAAVALRQAIRDPGDLVRKREANRLLTEGTTAEPIADPETLDPVAVVRAYGEQLLRLLQDLDGIRALPTKAQLVLTEIAELLTGWAWAHWVANNWGGQRVRALALLEDVEALADPPPPVDTAALPFIPNELQERILDALNRKALKLDALVNLLKVDRKTLCTYGLNELKAQGLVCTNRRVGGYYRPDAPPPKYADQLRIKPAE
jgi:hypothetical protein